MQNNGETPVNDARPAETPAGVLGRDWKMHLVTGGPVALLILLGVIDYVTGYEFNFFVFYFLPVAMVSWRAGASAGIAMSLACAGTWFLADVLTHSYSSAFYAYWNTGIRLMSFVAIALALAAMRDRLVREQKLNTELSQALNQVKHLKGLLPICSSCKKIRNDDGYWDTLETFISTHSEAEFTHGICPDCMKKLYPEYCEKVANKAKDSAEQGG